VLASKYLKITMLIFSLQNSFHLASISAIFGLFQVKPI